MEVVCPKQTVRKKSGRELSREHAKKGEKNGNRLDAYNGERCKKTKEECGWMKKSLTGIIAGRKADINGKGLDSKPANDDRAGWSIDGITVQHSQKRIWKKKLKPTCGAGSDGQEK